MWASHTENCICVLSEVSLKYDLRPYIPKFIAKPPENGYKNTRNQLKVSGDNAIIYLARIHEHYLMGPGECRGLFFYREKQPFRATQKEL